LMSLTLVCEDFKPRISSLHNLLQVSVTYSLRIQNFSSASRCEVDSMKVLPLVWDINFHIHIE
jgi:hypothetical protein